jgi:hypothetical protein
MGKTASILCIVFFGMIIILTVLVLTRPIIIKYAGESVFATVIRTPSHCSRRSEIDVMVGTKKYDLGISAANCRDGKYKIGQKVEVLRYKDYNEVIWPKSHPDLALLITLGLFAFAYFTERNKYLKEKRIKLLKTEKHRRKPRRNENTKK